MDSLHAIESVTEEIGLDSCLNATDNDDILEKPTLKLKCNTIEAGNWNTDCEDNWENVMLDINNTLERLRQTITSRSNKLSSLRKGKLFQKNYCKSTLGDYDNSRSGGMSYRSRSSFNVLSGQESNSIHKDIEKIEEGKTTRACKVPSQNLLGSSN